MVGLPLEVEDSSVSSVFPDAINGTLYSFDGSYTIAESLDNGTGYWLRFGSSGSSEITGEEITSLTLSLSEGWNLISGISFTIGVANIIDASNIIIDGTLYGYNGSYVSSDNITPGAGYWLRANADGDITLSSSQQSSRSIPTINHFSGANTLEFSNGIHSSTLYFGMDIPEGEDLSYSLPPTFPQMAYDARFTDNMRYTKDQGEISIINTSKYLSLSYSVNIHQGDYKEWVLTTESGEEYILTGTDEIVLNQETKSIIISKRVIIPQAFALHQNYPNPFNPVTTLRYDLPINNHVTLIIYDLNGREISRLVNINQAAGLKSIQWNATDNFGKFVSAGIYLYQIQSGGFIQTKKMVLLK
jgi:hypothetical protein